jgi:hypothetical protein
VEEASVKGWRGGEGAPLAGIITTHGIIRGLAYTITYRERLFTGGDVGGVGWDRRYDRKACGERWLTRRARGEGGCANGEESERVTKREL